MSTHYDGKERKCPLWCGPDEQRYQCLKDAWKACNVCGVDLCTEHAIDSYPSGLDLTICQDCNVKEHITTKLLDLYREFMADCQRVVDKAKKRFNDGKDTSNSNA